MDEIAFEGSVAVVVVVVAVDALPDLIVVLTAKSSESLSVQIPMDSSVADSVNVPLLHHRRSSTVEDLPRRV